jgi:hypothetical protein
MTVPKWLADYYGKDVDVLNPTVLIEGKTHAVVRLQKIGARGSSSVGFVLIRKGGSHQTSPCEPLGEGVTTTELVNKMTKRLAEVDDK